MTRSLLVLGLVCGVGPGTGFADPLTLVTDREIVRPIHRGEAIQTRIRLGPYEYISFHITPDHLALEVRILDPSGTLVKSVTPFDRGTDVTLANDLPGDYTIAITPTDSGGTPMVAAPITGMVTAATSGMNAMVSIPVPWTAWTGSYTGTFLFRLSTPTT